MRRKRELLRLAVTGDRVVADPVPSMPGRGAYVCGCECLARAQQRRALPRAFRRAVSVAPELLQSVTTWQKSA